MGKKERTLPINAQKQVKPKLIKMLRDLGYEGRTHGREVSHLVAVVLKVIGSFVLRGMIKFMNVALQTEKMWWVVTMVLTLVPKMIKPLYERPLYAIRSMQFLQANNTNPDPKHLKIADEPRFTESKFDVMRYLNDVRHLECNKFTKISIVQRFQVYLGKDYKNLPTAYNGAEESRKQAFYSRFLGKRPGFDEDTMKEYHKFHKDRFLPDLKLIIKRAKADGDFKYDIKAWMEHLPNKKRKEMAGAWESVNQRFNKIKREFVGMTKIEKGENTGTMNSNGEKVGYEKCGEVKDPRLVVFQQKETRAVMGPFYYALEKAWQKYLNGYGEPSNYSGLCHHIQDKVNRLGEGDPIVVCKDISKFDKNEYHELLENDVDVYDYAFEHMDFPDYISEEMIKNYNLIDTEMKDLKMGVHYMLNGTVPSGRNNTTEGNTRRNLEMECFIMYCANIRFNLLKWETPEVDAEAECKGDDSINAIKPAYISKYVECLSKVFVSKKGLGLGQEMKICKIVPLARMEFLSLEFLVHDYGIRAIRPLRRVLQFIGWSTKLTTQKMHYKARKMMWCEGINMLGWCKGLPIFQVIAEKMISHGIRCNQSEMEIYMNEYRIIDKVTDEQDMHVDDGELYMEYINRVHGISREMVKDFEAVIKNSDPFAVIEHEVYDMAMRSSNQGCYTYDLETGTIKEMDDEIAYPCDLMVDNELYIMCNPESEDFLLRKSLDDGIELRNGLFI